MDWVYVHLALNHIPVVGIPFVLFTVVFGWLRKKREILIYGLVLLAITAAATIAIKFTGDAAAEIVKETSQSETHFIDRHEESADQATTAAFVLFVASIVALLLGRGGKQTHTAALLVVLLAGMATCVLLARTANLGGQILHQEIRKG